MTNKLLHYFLLSNYVLLDVDISSKARWSFECYGEDLRVFDSVLSPNCLKNLLDQISFNIRKCYFFISFTVLVIFDSCYITTKC